MIKNFETKLSGSLNGMLSAERILGDNTIATDEAFELLRLLSKSQTPDIMSSRMPPSAWTRSSSAAVIGLTFHDRFGDVLDFCRTENLFSSPASQCAALGASILISSACFDVPLGIWPNEVGAILRGLDNYFVSLIDDATVAAMKTDKESEFFADMGKKADPDTSIVVMSMFSCIRGRSYKLAVDIAKDAGPHVASLTGAVMGAAFPDTVELKDPAVNELVSLIVARRSV
jgi:hypothetical protein